MIILKFPAGFLLVPGVLSQSPIAVLDVRVDVAAGSRPSPAYADAWTKCVVVYGNDQAVFA